MKKDKELTLQEKEQLSFLSPQKNLHQAWENAKTGNQDRWPILCLQAVEEALGQLDKGPVTAQIFYNLLASKRHEIAETLDQPDKKILGMKRERDLRTPITAPDNPEASYNTKSYPYGDQHHFLLEKFKQCTARADAHCRIIKDEDVQGYQSGNINTPYSYHIIMIQLYGDTREDRALLPLSKISLYTSIPFDKDKAAETLEEWFFNDEAEEALGLFNRCSSPLMVYHSTSQSFSPVFNAIEPMFQKILFSNNMPEAQLFPMLGEIAWYLAQATPLSRGSMATSDMFIKTLLKHQGYSFGPYKEGLAWDLDAIFTPDKEIFAARFIDCFLERPAKNIEIKRVEILHLGHYQEKIKEEKINASSDIPRSV